VNSLSLDNILISRERERELALLVGSWLKIFSSSSREDDDSRYGDANGFLIPCLCGSERRNVWGA
jgi:hypothetical protein